MNELTFLADWGAVKERAWSGTYWGLCKALEQHFNLTDIDTSCHDCLAHKLLRKMGLFKLDMECAHISSKRKRLSALQSTKRQLTVFQFDETILSNESIKSFVYKDLTVSYVRYMKAHLPEVFLQSGFGKHGAESIEKRNRMEQEGFQSISGIFCMGEWLRKDCIERMGLPEELVHAVGGGINVAVDKIRPMKKEGNRILFVGRDFKRKGGYLVYDAFCELKKRLPDAELYIAGPDSNPIATPASGYIYMGDCHPDSLSELFNKCDIFCMPSYFEAYGLAFIEALTYGLPCIGRRCYEMPYFIKDGETGYLIDSDDTSRLADKMFSLLSDAVIKENVLRKREWYISNYSWDAVAERISDVIHDACNR